MKRKVFAAMFAILSHLLLMGWSLIPKEVFYRVKGEVIYNPNYYWWGLLGTAIAGFLYLISLYELGGRLYDKLK